MRHRLFTLISRAREDLQRAEEMVKAETANGEIDGDMPDKDNDRSLHEARARVLALEARVKAIEERSKE